MRVASALVAFLYYYWCVMVNVSLPNSLSVCRQCHLLRLCQRATYLGSVVAFRIGIGEKDFTQTLNITRQRRSRVVAEDTRRL
jgi:hypothetical protein